MANSLECPKCERWATSGPYCPYCGAFKGKRPVLCCTKGHGVIEYHLFCPGCGEDFKQHPPKPWPWWKRLLWLNPL